MKNKNEVQREIIDTLLEKKMKGIMLASVRSGKTRQLLTAIKEYWKEDYPPLILIAFPNKDIKKSWKEECNKLEYYPNILYSTFMSLHKYANKKFDFILIDESHLLSPNTQLPVACALSKINKHVIFASGTYSKETLEELQIHSGLDLIVNYTTDDAIDDGIVSNFTLFIHQYSLDNLIQREFGKTKKWISTDLKECNRLTKKVEESTPSEMKFNALNRMRFINSNKSLIKKVNKWILDNPDERFLLFAPDENTGKQYHVPMFNSKSKNDDNLRDFQSGDIDRLCLIKKASSGVTFKNLRIILITSINSNGEHLLQQIGRSLLNDTEASEIHIFISNEKFQLKWLEKSLVGLNKDKIVWV